MICQGSLTLSLRTPERAAQSCEDHRGISGAEMGGWGGGHLEKDWEEGRERAELLGRALLGPAEGRWGWGGVAGPRRRGRGGVGLQKRGERQKEGDRQRKSMCRGFE